MTNYLLFFKESYNLFIYITLFFAIILSYLNNNNNIMFFYGIVLYFLIIFALILFYREPKFVLNNYIDNNILYCPTYGTIMNIKNNYNNNNTTKISIFLSVFDPHIQWIPINCKIINKEFKDKGFYFANNLEKSLHNVKLITHLDTNKYGIIKIVQSTGFFVRRLVSWVNIGDNVKTGDKLGMIKFGSRVDIEFSNLYFELNSKDIFVGNYISGLNTILAYPK